MKEENMKDGKKNFGGPDSRRSRTTYLLLP
jgi:hypothetical protein